MISVWEGDRVAVAATGGGLLGSDEYLDRVCVTK